MGVCECVFVSVCDCFCVSIVLNLVLLSFVSVLFCLYVCLTIDLCVVFLSKKRFSFRNNNLTVPEFLKMGIF